MLRQGLAEIENTLSALTHREPVHVKSTGDCFKLLLEFIREVMWVRIFMKSCMGTLKHLDYVGYFFFKIDPVFTHTGQPFFKIMEPDVIVDTLKYFADYMS